MGLGALAWAASNLLWLAGWPIYRIVFWWAGYLILTIAGERLELGRLLRLSRRAEAAFLAAAGLFILGLILSISDFSSGARVTGLGLLALAAWLLRFDIARRTIRQKSLPRFAAICLLAGYFWLGIGGLLSVIYGGTAAGPIYDAILHSIFLGFVISMIFGHAPIIFPAVLRLPITYSPVFYLHLILLHSSLLVRVVADLAGNQPLRLYGGLFNGIAILVFLCVTVHAVVRRTRNASLDGKPARITQP
jgi:hypothetical protein